MINRAQSSLRLVGVSGEYAVSAVGRLEVSAPLNDSQESNDLRQAHYQILQSLACRGCMSCCMRQFLLQALSPHLQSDIACVLPQS